VQMLINPTIEQEEGMRKPLLLILMLVMACVMVVGCTNSAGEVDGGDNAASTSSSTSQTDIKQVVLAETGWSI